MKKNILMVGIMAALLAFTPDTTTKWNVDNMHATLGFSVTHMGINDIQGQFKKFSSKITASKADLTDAVVEMTAEVSSISTDVEPRDKHLKSADFFDAEKFPTISFKSSSFTKVGDKKYKVKGPLTMHGVTKDVELEATLNGVTANPMSKKPTSGWKVTGKIKRNDFGIGASMPEAMLSNEVTLNANAEFVQE